MHALSGGLPLDAVSICVVGGKVSSKSFDETSAIIQSFLLSNFVLYSNTQLIIIALYNISLLFHNSELFHAVFQLQMIQ